MKRVAWVLALLALSSLAACGDDPPAKGASASAGAPGVAPPPTSPEGAPASSAAPEPTAPLPKFPVVEQDFAENERSRYPFRAFSETLQEESKGARSQRQVVLSEYAIDELKLIGIVTRAQPAKAMLLDPAGTGHIVQRGQFVGRADVVQGAGRAGASYEVNWRVDRIRDGDIVLIREDPANPDVPSATRVIPLRPEGSQVQ